MIYQIQAEVISNVELSPGYYRMTLKAGKIAQEAKPGQFLHLRVTSGTSPLLRRPFSISSLKGPEVEILYKVVGKGTTLLAEYEANRKIDLIGPLGNGFVMDRESGGRIIIAGGIGVAPAVAVAESLHTEGKPFTVLLGAKTKEELVGLEGFEKLGVNPQITTEDGSCGDKGVVTELLSVRGHDQIFACGPWNMLKEVANIASKSGVYCQVSVETQMACGVGACLGCAIGVRQVEAYGSEALPYTYKLVCRDGPVFDAMEIDW